MKVIDNAKDSEEGTSSSSIRSTPTKRRRPRQLLNHLVTTRERQELIRLVIEEEVSIKAASTSLHLNYSTAKSIMADYRKTGRLLNKKKEYNMKALAKISELQANTHEETTSAPTAKTSPQSDMDA